MLQSNRYCHFIFWLTHFYNAELAHREPYIDILFFQDLFQLQYHYPGTSLSKSCKIWTWITTIMRFVNLHTPKYLCVYVMFIHHKFVNGFTFARSVSINCFFSFLPGTFGCIWWFGLCWHEKLTLILFFLLDWICIFFFPAAWDSRPLTPIIDTLVSFLQIHFAMLLSDGTCASHDLYFVESNQLSWKVALEWILLLIFTRFKYTNN